MEIAHFYVLPCSRGSSAFIYAEYNKNYSYYYRSDHFSLADEEYPGINSCRKNALVVAELGMVFIIAIIDIKPGKQQFIYLFPVLKEMVR